MRYKALTVYVVEGFEPYLAIVIVLLQPLLGIGVNQIACGWSHTCVLLGALVRMLSILPRTDMSDFVCFRHIDLFSISY